MSKKIERLFRDRPLSESEVASDQEIRRKVRAEFPPSPPGGRTSGVLSQALRDAIRASGQSLEQLAEASGVSSSVLARFLSGERDIHVSTADKVAAVLGLKLAAAT